MAASEPAGARVHRWVLLSSAALAGLGHETYRLYALYVAPNGREVDGLVAAAGGVVSALTFAHVSDRRGTHSEHRLVVAFLFGAVGAALFAILPFLFFATPGLALAIPLAGVAWGTGACALAVREGTRALAPAAGLDLPGHFVHPLRVGFAAALLGGAAALAAHIGFMRTGFVVSATLALSATFAQLPGKALGLAPSRFDRSGHCSAAAVAAVASVLTVAAEHWVPIREVWAYPEDIVHAETGDSHRYVVAAAPGGYELFSDDQVAVATLDAGRYERALARPALRLARSTHSVLLALGGAGTLEREILSDPNVERLTVVVEDSTLASLSRKMPWLASLGEEPGLGRERIVVAEPAAFLRRSAERFDVIVANLPAPIGYRAGKYYTRYFYELMAAHLADGGLFVAPAASAFDAKEAFASVLATVAAAGLHARPYHAAIPTLGLTSFVVASKAELPASRNGFEGVAMDDGADLAVVASGAVSTLYDQRVVTEFDARGALPGPFD